MTAIIREARDTTADAAARRAWDVEVDDLRGYDYGWPFVARAVELTPHVILYGTVIDWNRRSRRTFWGLGARHATARANRWALAQ